MPRFDFNIIVIGAGSAGLVSAYIAAATKAKVALIEKHRMGGDCLNTGCVPSKALIKAAKTAYKMQHSAHLGIHGKDVEINFEEVMAHVHQSIKTIQPHDSVERYTDLGVDCFEGEARITSPNSVKINGKTLTARSIIVATGASPQIPDVEGISDIDVLTSENLWQLKQLPEKLLVVGGGTIGVELAQAFSRLGSYVTLSGRNSALLKKEDPEVSEFLIEKFKKEGINVLTGHALQSFKIENGRKIAILKNNNEEISIEFDEVLIASGRQANVTGFGLQELGVKLTKGNQIAANPFLQTNIPGIYVCGDVTGPYQFTHAAAHQAWYASVNALFSPYKKFKVDYRVIPWVTFSDPEVARVGINQQEAIQQGIPHEVTIYGLNDLDRAITDSAAEGFVKVITPHNRDKILGVTIVGEHAGDMLPEFVLAMRYNLGLGKILGTIHPYPTLSEANKYVAGNWRKNHMPVLALKLLEKFHAWRR